MGLGRTDEYRKGPWGSPPYDRRQSDGMSSRKPQILYDRGLEEDLDDSMGSVLMEAEP